MSLLEKKKKKLSNFLGGRVEFDVDMGQHSTFRTGGKAFALANISNEKQLTELIALCESEQIAYMVIGGGSNLLVGSNGYKGLFIRLRGDFAKIVVLADNMLEVGAGCSLARCLQQSGKLGLSGLEFLVAIPGTVGGAVRMNGGAFGQEIGELVVALKFFVPGVGVVEKTSAECDFSYRNLVVDGLDLAASVLMVVKLQLVAGRGAEIESRKKELIGRRRKSQPYGFASAGSFFRNPPDDYAGRLIESVGLKGLQVGGAQVSIEHANFIINKDGEATPDDVISLMRLVQEKVMQEKGILLEPEVHIVG